VAGQGAGAYRAGTPAGLDSRGLAIAAGVRARPHGTRRHGDTVAHAARVGRARRRGGAGNSRGAADPAHCRYRHLKAAMLSALAITLAGAGGAVAAWLMLRPALAMRMPPDASAAMSWGWRLCWPWLSAGAVVCGPLLSWRLRDALARRLAQAGLPPAVTAAHAAAAVAGAAACGAFLAGGLAWWLGAAVAWPAARLAGALFMGGWPVAWASRRIGRRRQRVGRELPFVLDMMTLCIESGLGLHGALQQAAQHGPPGPLRQELHHALADMRAGMPRVAALKALAE